MATTTNNNLPEKVFYKGEIYAVLAGDYAGFTDSYKLASNTPDGAPFAATKTECKPVYETREVANRNSAQKTYVATKREAMDLTKQIQRAINDSPAAVRDWTHVGEMYRLISDLQEIRDRLYETGEYGQEEGDE